MHGGKVLAQPLGFGCVTTARANAISRTRYHPVIFGNIPSSLGRSLQSPTCTAGMAPSRP
jgi:hypothetical protein